MSEPHEIPDEFTLIEGAEGELLAPPPLTRELAEEERLLKRLLKLSRDARLRVRLALQMLEEERGP